MPPLTWECIIWLGSRNATCRFISVPIRPILSLNVKQLFFKPCATASAASVLVGFACPPPVSLLYSCFLKSTWLDIFPLCFNELCNSNMCVFAYLHRQQTHRHIDTRHTFIDIFFVSTSAEFRRFCQNVSSDCSLLTALSSLA